jgi:hypothetical protein
MGATMLDSLQQPEHSIRKSRGRAFNARIHKKNSPNVD